MISSWKNKKGVSMSALIKSEEGMQDWEVKKELLKRTICKGSTDEELELFIHACKRTGLDPFMKQIYAVKRWSGSEKREVMTMQTSIDGFRVIAERTGRYAPGAETKYEYDSEKNLISATSYVKKLTLDGTWHVVSATAFFDEYAQRTKDGNLSQFWGKMPHVMLAKCAESLALRKAFPAELSGIYTMEEMSQASKVSGNEDATTIDHAIALEMSRKTEEELVDEFFYKMRHVPHTDKLTQHLEFCLSKTKKSKKEFLEGAINEREKYLESYKLWLHNNFPKLVDEKEKDLLQI